MSNVQIKKIVIRIGDKEATLTPEDAKELMEVLEGLMGKKEVVKEYIAYPIYVPPVVSTPYIPWWGVNTIWSSGEIGNGVDVTYFGSQSSMSESRG